MDMDLDAVVPYRAARAASIAGQAINLGTMIYRNREGIQEVVGVGMEAATYIGQTAKRGYTGFVEGYSKKRVIESGKNKPVVKAVEYGQRTYSNMAKRSKYTRAKRVNRRTFKRKRSNKSYKSSRYSLTKVEKKQVRKIVKNEIKSDNPVGVLHYRNTFGMVLSQQKQNIYFTDRYGQDLLHFTPKKLLVVLNTMFKKAPMVLGNLGNKDRIDTPGSISATEIDSFDPTMTKAYLNSSTVKYHLRNVTQHYVNVAIYVCYPKKKQDFIAPNVAWVRAIDQYENDHCIQDGNVPPQQATAATLAETIGMTPNLTQKHDTIFNYKKTEIMMTPGQTYDFILNGPSGMIDFKRHLLNSTGPAAVPGTDSYLVLQPGASTTSRVYDSSRLFGMTPKSPAVMFVTHAYTSNHFLASNSSGIIAPGSAGPERIIVDYEEVYKFTAPEALAMHTQVIGGANIVRNDYKDYVGFFDNRGTIDGAYGAPQDVFPANPVTYVNT